MTILITVYSAFPSLVQLADGDLMCAFRRAPNRVLLWDAPHIMHWDPNSYLVLVRSSDGGETWTREPELIYAHPLGGSQDPCMTALDDGSIVCASYAWAQVPPEGEQKLKDVMIVDHYAYLGGYVLRSEDRGKSWLGPFVPMHVKADGTFNALGNPCPAYNRGQIIQCSDGKLYWAVASTSQSDRDWHTTVHLLTSVDRGENWQYNCVIAEDDNVGFNETSLLETINGDIIAFLRTSASGMNPIYVDNLTYARSTDGGKSFGPWQAGFVGAPSQAVRLKDGRVFLTYGYRNEPFGIRARLLNPDCTNAADAPEFIIRDDGGSWDVGYPWAVQLADGKVLVAYYINVAQGTRHIAGSLVDVE